MTLNQPTHTPPAPAPRPRFAALCILATLSIGMNAVRAQEKPAPQPAAATAGKTAAESSVTLDKFVVTGVRASLISAEEIKRNSFQVMDSIVAEDIGKLPDNTVADALQRVPGIQVARDNGEVNSVVIRGLPNLGTTLNGHEIFTGTGRGVALQDIPAELVAGIDVFKSSAPNQIEGGIAGLIDIRLHRPFDFSGLQIAGGVRAIEGKYAEDTSWVGSILVSDRWKLDGGGEFGALVSLSGSKYHFMDQRVFNFLWEPVATGIAATPTVMLPVTAGSLITPGDRDRTGVSVSLQYRPTSNLEFYTDFLYTAYKNVHDVNFFIGFPRFGAFQTINLVPGTNVVDNEVTTNNFHLNSTQAFDDNTDSYQWVGGVKWTNGPLTLSSDVIYNWSSFKNRAVIVDVQYVAPSTFTFDLINDNGTNVNVTGGNIRDGNNYRFWGLFDNHGYQTSDQITWKADAAYQLGEGVITAVKGGVRYSDREAKSRQTSQNDIPPVAGRGVLPTTSLAGFGGNAPDSIFSSSDFGASNWYAGDADFQRDHVAQLRPIFGQPVTDPNFNPTQSFTDSERTFGGYIQADYKFDLGKYPLEGLIGARFVNTREDLSGYLANGNPVTDYSNEWDVLPVVNGRTRLSDKMMFRYSIGKTITRPNFADLNPVVTLNGPTTTGGSVGTGSGGNPDLENVTSTNYDISFEYYIEKGSYFAVTPFYRSIDGYVQTFASVETIGGTNYIVTRPRNSGKGHLQGVELTYQHFPNFPGWLKGLGWQLNYTYIDGDTKASDPTSTANPAPMIDLPFPQVSKNSYNIIGIYERGPFSVRVAYNWRGDYIDTYNGPNSPTSGLRTIHVKDTDRMDFSASYALGKHWVISFDATNLLNQKYQDYFGDDPNLYQRDTRRYDQTFELGVRYRY